MADIYELYNNLPGVRVRTNFDYKKEVSLNTSSTEAVLILGTAKDGPDEPYRLKSVQEGLATYGNMGDVTTPALRRTHIARGILEANEAGCNDIWVMRISGKKANLSQTDTGAFLDLEALYGGEKYGNTAGTAGLGVIISEDRIMFKDLSGNVRSIKFVDGTTTYATLVEVINSLGMDTKVKAGIRGTADPYQAITSSKPAVVECSNAQYYDFTPGTNNVLHFDSVDGDTNSSNGFNITFDGTRGTSENAACQSRYFILRGVNDVISLRADSMSAGTYESVSVLNSSQSSAWFTGSELATRLQTKLDANSAITNSGARDITCSFFLNAAPFSIAISAGTIAFDYETSTIGDTIGFTADKTAGTSIVSDAEAKYNVIQNANDKFVLNENGQYTRDCTVYPGIYTATTLTTAINDAILLSGGTTSCTQLNGVYTFTSSRYGSSSSSVLAAGSTDFLPAIGFDGTVTLTQGTGFAAFLDHATAQEVADAITAASTCPGVCALPFTNSANAISLKIYSMARGAGQITTGSDVTSTANTVLGIDASTSFSGQTGNLPVTLPSTSAQTYTWRYMSGGDDELSLTNDQLLDKLADAYGLLEDIEGVDYIVPLGAYVFVDSFGALDYRHATNLALCCIRRSVLGHFTHGIISYEPIKNPNLASVKARVDYLKTVDMDINLMDDYYSTTTNPGVSLQEQNGQMLPMSIRSSISFNVGPELVFNQPYSGPYVMTGEAAYAGRACSLPVNSATTGKRVGGPLHLFYKYGKGALNDLVGVRGLCFYEDQDSKVRVVSDVTYDESGNTYDDLMTFRIMASIVNDQYKMFAPYIGEAVSDKNINSIGSLIQRYLDGLKATGIINDFKYDLVSSGASRMGKVFLYQTIVTPDELKKVVIVNTLSNKLS